MALLGCATIALTIRLSAFLLVCIGVQIVWNGIGKLLATTPVQTKLPLLFSLMLTRSFHLALI